MILTRYVEHEIAAIRVPESKAQASKLWRPGNGGKELIKTKKEQQLWRPAVKQQKYAVLLLWLWFSYVKS